MRKRIPHVIKENKNSEYPRHFIFFDTETNEEKLSSTESRLTLKFGEAVYWRRRTDGKSDQEKWITFTTIPEFWDFIEDQIRERTRMIIVSHNLAFDMKVLQAFRELKERKWRTEKIIVNGTSSIWQFRKGTRTILALDNMNYFKSSLAKLGEALGVPKLTMPETDGITDEWITYCRRDVEVMLMAWKTWFKFLNDNDLGSFGMTLASQAMNAYRHRFMPHKIYIHDFDNVIKMERAAYHGGRTECFALGKMPEDDYYVLDVNSMYPAQMKNNDYPTKYVGSRNSPTLSNVRSYIKKYCVIAECEIESTESCYGTVIDNRLVFPVGHFAATLTTREVEYGLERGIIKKVVKINLYDKHNIFLEYVSFFYARRMEYKNAGNDAFAYLGKLMLNSLYGKFGQRNEVFEEVGEDHGHDDAYERYFDIDLERWITRRYINGVIEESQGQKEGFNSFVAIAAHVTGDARIALWRYIRKAGLENVYYCDTDSVFTNEQGKERLRSVTVADKLGYLSVKGHTRSLEIFGPKDYLLGSSRVIKGVRGDAEIIGPGRFSQVKFEGFLGALHAGRLNEMRIATVEKRLSRVYKKGIVGRDGRITPYVLNDY